VLADSHALFRRGLSSLFSSESDLQVVAEASNLTEVLTQVQLHTPRVLLIDLAMVSELGTSGHLALRQMGAEMGILVTTREDGPEQLETALKAGARGYMMRNSTAASLVAGVRQIATSGDQNPRGLSRIVPDLRALAAANNSVRASVLTSREQEVMRLLAEGRTVREVASDLALSIKTIEAHKLNLMRKLDLHNRASLVECAVRMGLIVVQPQPA
jgi:two-component system, NarL family, response regulator NreC